MGQHKNNRNYQRAFEAGDRMNRRALQLEEKQEDSNFRNERKKYVESKVNIEEYLVEAI